MRGDWLFASYGKLHVQLLKLISTNPLSPLSIKHNKVNTLSEMVFYSRVVFHMNTTKVDIFKK